jgi:lysophospholipase L1-like esterase
VSKLQDPHCRRGLVALGDSITVGEGQAMLGTRCQSWALWLAEALELPYTNLAVNGAQARELGRQVQRMRGPYELCCLYAGVNDARAVGFDPGAFADALERAAAAAAGEADHLLMVTIPLDLGRPPAGRSVLEANRLVREVAGRHRATVVSLEGLRGWRLVLPDAVHVTARGQVELAERAARALRADGFAVPVSPTALADAAEGWRAAAWYTLTGHAAALARDLRRRVRERG